MPINHFSREKNLQEYAAGETIFERGDISDCMYGVAEGEVEVYIDSTLVETIGPGAIVGELALIDDSPPSGSAVAESDCKLAAIDEQKSLFMVDDTPYFALEVMRSLTRRLRNVDQVAFGATD
jgi:CRP-like cAMP-binding protein